MSHVYANTTRMSVKQKIKINYFSPKTWRIMYLIQTNNVHHTSEKRIRGRGSVIPVTFLGYEIIVHSGKRWHRRYVNRWMIGFRFGEFTWNRRLALYKAKQLRKKNKGKGKNKGK